MFDRMLANEERDGILTEIKKNSTKFAYLCLNKDNLKMLDRLNRAASVDMNAMFELLLYFDCSSFFGDPSKEAVTLDSLHSKDKEISNNLKEIITRGEKKKLKQYLKKNGIIHEEFSMGLKNASFSGFVDMDLQAWKEDFVWNKNAPHKKFWDLSFSEKNEISLDFPSLMYYLRADSDFRNKFYQSFWSSLSFSLPAFHLVFSMCKQIYDAPINNSIPSSIKDGLVDFLCLGMETKGELQDLLKNSRNAQTAFRDFHVKLSERHSLLFDCCWKANWKNYWKRNLRCLVLNGSL